MMLIRILFLGLLNSILSYAFEAPNQALLQCFRYHYNYWLVGFAFHTTSVTYKDECLRDCLTAELRGNVTCKSAMHVPDDEECILADQNQASHPELFIKNERQDRFSINYYENICSITPVNGGQVAARLSSYRGSEGTLKMVQAVDSGDAYVSTILYNLPPGQQYELHLVDSPEDFSDKSCNKIFFNSIRPNKNFQLGDKRSLMTIKTDHTGMAVVAWKQLPVTIYGIKSAVNKLVLVSHLKTRQLETCGMVQPIGNYSAYAKKFVVKAGNSNLASILTLLCGLIGFFYIWYHSYFY